MNLLKRALFALAVASFSSLAMADERPVELVVPFSPGGATDSFARILAKELGASLQVPVVVVNRPGAGGGVGAASVTKAAPDGKTILLGTISTHAINPALYKDLSYDANQDFTPVARVVALPNLLAVSAASDVTTVEELVAKSRKQPLTFGSPGSGTTSHLSGELMKQIRPEMQINHVPYRGSAPAITDLLGGHIDFQFDNISALLPHVLAGKLRPLAVSSTTPSEQLPQVKPLAEQGFANYEIVSWFGLWLPKGASTETVSRLNQALAQIYAKPDFVKTLTDASITPSYLPGADFDRFVRSEQDKWRDVVQSAGLKL